MKGLPNSTTFAKEYHSTSVFTGPDLLGTGQVGTDAAFAPLDLAKF